MNAEQTGRDVDPAPRTKADLVARIQKARAAFDRAIAPLSEAQMVARGPAGEWSVKDHIAHLAAWERGIAAVLQRRPRWEAMGLDQEIARANDDDAINAIIQERNKDRSLLEALSGFHRAQQELLEALEPLSDADLFRPYSRFQAGEGSSTPMIRLIAGNTYEHYDEHKQYVEELVARRAR